MILTDLDLPTFDKLLKLLRAHTDLKNTVVAIVDINHPQVADQTVNILRDFQALDELIESSQAKWLGVSFAIVQTTRIEFFRRRKLRRSILSLKTEPATWVFPCTNL